jgi:hypothetical protein
MCSQQYDSVAVVRSNGILFAVLKKPEEAKESENICGTFTRAEDLWFFASLFCRSLSFFLSLSLVGKRRHFQCGRKAKKNAIWQEITESSEELWAKTEVPE